MTDEAIKQRIEELDITTGDVFKIEGESKS
jgi:hypothetical protein